MNWSADSVITPHGIGPTNRKIAVTQSFEIRPVGRDDFLPWKYLWDRYNAFYGRSESTDLPLEVTQMTWSRFFDAYEPMHALVAEQSGTSWFDALSLPSKHDPGGSDLLPSGLIHIQGIARSGN